MPGPVTVSAEDFVKVSPDAPFWGFMGAAFALVFANIGAAYGTGKSGIGISSLGVGKPELVMKSIVPVVMAGVLGIYGLIIAVIISNEVGSVAEGKVRGGQPVGVWPGEKVRGGVGAWPRLAQVA